jgi:PIN domain nuclease of toxin-antitoxin system
MGHHPKRARLRLLLDTHASVWWSMNKPSLSRRAHDAIADPDNEPWVSAVSGYGLAYKQLLGKLQPPLADELTTLVRLE